MYGTLFLRMACVYISMIRQYGPLCKHMIPSYGLVWSASLGWCIAPQTSPNSGLPWLPAQGDTAWAAIGTYVNTHKIINTWCFVRSIKRKEQEQTKPNLFGASPDIWCGQRPPPTAKASTKRNNKLNFWVISDRLYSPWIAHFPGVLLPYMKVLTRSYCQVNIYVNMTIWCKWVRELQKPKQPSKLHLGWHQGYYTFSHSDPQFAQLA